MDGGQDNSPVFRSDDITTSKSHSNNGNLFVKVTKNPLLRWFLRSKKVEEQKPKLTPVPQPQIQKPVEKPKPQFRATIRVSVAKLKKSLQKTRQTTIILVCVIFICLAGLAFFAFKFFANSKSDHPSSPEITIATFRNDLLEILESAPVESENIDDFINQMDAKINLLPTGDEKQSLKLYKFYLLINTNYYAEALEYFNELEQESFTEPQLCELYEYRLLISENSSDSSDISNYRTKYRTACGIKEDIKPEEEQEEDKNEEGNQDEDQNEE